VSLLIPLFKNFLSEQKSSTEGASPAPTPATPYPGASPAAPSRTTSKSLAPLHVQPNLTENLDLYSYSIQFHSFPYEILRVSHFSSKLFILWGFLTIWKGVRPAKSTRNEYLIQTRLIPARKNKKRFSDVQGIEKFLPVLKTLIESFKRNVLFSKKISYQGAKLWEGAATGGGFARGAPAGTSSPRPLGILKYPKGYLFIGPPGTGKTLLAQAVAGEANVNLLCLSASEIQKQIDIGTRIGAIRLRNLFEQARKNTPCILFLDEIDAIGRARNEGMDLKLFTEFLIQMDSFSVKDGFIVIGTTNFLSSLDSAFVRSGRFDRIIGLNYPGKQTRISILKLYTEKGRNSFDTSISWNFFGERTIGLSAADLAKVVNESSLYLIQTKYLGGAEEINEQSSVTVGGRRGEVGLRPATQTSSATPYATPYAGYTSYREAPTPPTPLGTLESSFERQTGLVRVSYKTQFQKILFLMFWWLPFLSSQEKLVHTTISLERGLERISHLSKS